MIPVELTARARCGMCYKYKIYWATIRAYLDIPGDGQIGIKYDPPEGWIEKDGSLYCLSCANELDD